MGINNLCTKYYGLVRSSVKVRFKIRVRLRSSVSC